MFCDQLVERQERTLGAVLVHEIADCAATEDVGNVARRDQQVMRFTAVGGVGADGGVDKVNPRHRPRGLFDGVGLVVALDALPVHMDRQFQRLLGDHQVSVRENGRRQRRSREERGRQCQSLHFHL